jgi:RNA polymerase sigma-70 factor (ECF subfamily)
MTDHAGRAYAESADAELVERSRRGDRRAFEALVRRHYGAAFAVALGRLGNRMDAEDVCQEAFVRALERLDDCREPARFVGWLLVIVRNRALNRVEYRRVRQGVSLEDVEPASAQDPARDVSRADLRDRLTEALSALTPVQREVVLLHDLEGWKHREIGEALDLTEVASRQHLFTARRALRDTLGDVMKEELIDD